MCEDGQLASKANLWKSSISASSRISASCKFSTRPDSQQPHVLLIPSGFILLEFKCVLHQEYKYTWIFYGSPLLLWVGKSEDEGEKKQMLMRFLAKLRPLLWMHLKKLKQTAGESQVFPPWSSLKKSSTLTIWGFSKISGMKCSCMKSHNLVIVLFVHVLKMKHKGPDRKKI